MTRAKHCRLRRHYFLFRLFFINFGGSFCIAWAFIACFLLLLLLNVGERRAVAMFRAFAYRFCQRRLKAMSHDATFPATCLATLLRDKLQEKLRV